MSSPEKELPDLSPPVLSETTAGSLNTRLAESTARRATIAGTFDAKMISDAVCDWLAVSISPAVSRRPANRDSHVIKSGSAFLSAPSTMCEGNVRVIVAMEILIGGGPDGVLLITVGATVAAFPPAAFVPATDAAGAAAEACGAALLGATLAGPPLAVLPPAAFEGAVEAATGGATGSTTCSSSCPRLPDPTITGAHKSVGESPSRVMFQTGHAEAPGVEEIGIVWHA